MADDDNDKDNDTSKKGGGVAGVAAGGVVGYAGTVGIAQALAKPKDLEEQITKAAAEHIKTQKAFDAAKKTAEKTLLKEPENKKLAAAFSKTDIVHKAASKKYISAAETAWKKGLKTAKPEDLGSFAIAGLEGEIKSIKGAPVSTAQNWVLEEAKATHKAMKAIDFKSLKTPKAAEKAIDDAVKTVEKEFAKTMPNGANTLKSTLLDKAKFETFEAMGKVKSPIAEKIVKSTKGLKDSVETAAKELKDAKGKWVPKIESAAPAETKALKAAEKASQKLSGLKVINAEKGFLPALSRPVKLFKHAGTGTKLGIVGSFVALGTLAYMGVRALRNRSNDEGMSHVERLEQSRQKGTPEQSPA